MTSNYVLIYILEVEQAAKIKYNVKIDKNLAIEVSIGDKIMDPLDLTWIVPVYSKIVKWSQLRVLLAEFGSICNTSR